MSVSFSTACRTPAVVLKLAISRVSIFFLSVSLNATTGTCSLAVVESDSLSLIVTDFTECYKVTLLNSMY